MQEIGHLVHFKYIFLAFIFFAGFSFAQKYPDDKIHNILTQGIQEIINHDYEAARTKFEKLTRDYPNNPLGKIYLAAVEIARSYDNAEEFNDQLIMNYLDEAEAQSEKLLAKEPKNVWNKYFLALVKGYNAYYKALNESWIPAFTKGMSSVSDFEDCLEINPEFYESYIAIGAYKYWSSSKTEFINWLPFISDDKDKGIDYLKKAIKYSTYNSYLAAYSLIWVYIDRENFSDAEKVAEDALKKNPGSRLFKWGLARIYEEIDKKKAINLYYEVLKSYPPEGLKNHINEVVIKHIIAQLYYKLGQKENALQICNDILSIKDFSEFAAEELDSRIERVKKLKRKILQDLED